MKIDHTVEKRIVEQKEKECEICGAIFVVTQHNRKYCDKCRTHPETEKRHLARAYHDSYKRFRDIENPELVKVACAYCGKEKTTLAKAAKSIYFCSNDCKVAFNKEHDVCKCCGKSLKDSKFYDGIHWDTQFCDQGCRDTYLRKCAENEKSHGWGKYSMIHVCEGCGKPFIRNDKNARFCSQECFKEAQSRKKAARLLIVKECPYCKKTFSSETDKTFCSKECYMAAVKEGWKSDASLRWEAQRKKEQEETQKEREERQKEKQKERERAKEERQKERERAKKEKSEKVKPKEGEQLCATCKVSYKDCERMQSNFRILPKGAHYNSAGVLTVCPKYKA